MPAGGNVLHVCIVGPDGAGKTTVARGVSEALDAAGWAVHPVKPRPRTIDARTNRDFDYRAPQARPPRSAWRSTTKLLGKLGYAWARTLSDRVRHRGAGPTVLIEERGWLDHGVDYLRYRIHPRAARLVPRLARLTPRPDVSIVLTGDAHELADRKGELSRSEVTRQLDRWQELCAADVVPGARIVDTSTTAEDPTIDRVTKMIVDLH